MTATLTAHAIQRAAERLNLGESSLQRLADTALLSGLMHNECQGKLRRYIDKLFLENRTANNIRIYGDNVFLFASAILITVFPLPQIMKPIATKMLNRRT